MQVVKRNGEKQDINFEKIHWRIKSMCAKADIIEFQKEKRPEAYQITQSLNEIDMPTFSSPALTQIILDGPPGQILQTYCMPSKDLLISMIKDGINPLTETKYSRATIDRVRSNFSTELKLVEHALKISLKLRKAPYSLTPVSYTHLTLPTILLV